MQRSYRDLLIILGVTTVCFLLNLGGPHLWDRDEPRNAGCAAEMLAAGDWITPTFNAQLREHKPVLTYWLMMLSYLVFGVNEFAARLPSALLGIGTTLLTWFLARRLFRESTGLWAAIAIATTMMFGVASRAATPDAPLIFFSTLAISIFIFGTTVLGENGEGQFVRLFPNLKLSILMYLAMGFAVLAKGPIGLVIPTAVIGMFLLVRRLPPTRSSDNRRPWFERLVRCARPFTPIHFLKTCVSMRPLTAIVCALVVALPWYWLVHIQTNGEWTYGFFVKHNVGRAMNAMDGHRGNVLFYPVALIIGFFPFSIFWIPTLFDGIRSVKSNARQANGYLFAFCWVGVYLALFSLAKTKLPSYITPCYPGLAIAIGAFVDRWSQQEVDVPIIWQRFAFGSLIAVGIGVLIAIPILAALFVPGEASLALLGLIPLIGGIAAFVMAEKRRHRHSIYATTCTALLMSPAIFAFAADQIDDHRQVEQFVERLYDGQATEDVDVISYSDTEASWVFYAQQPIEPIYDPEEAAQQLLTPSESGQPRVLVTVGVRMKKIEPFLEKDKLTIQQMPYFMKDTEIVIIRPKPEIIQAASEVPNLR